MDSVFSAKNYKEYLKKIIDLNHEERGFQARMAEAAGCQPSYLSQVLKGKVDLLPDHSVGIAKFLQLSNLESDMLHTLIQKDRARMKDYQVYLQQKIEKLKETRNLLQERLNVQKASKSIEHFYYSSWYWSAIHISTSISSLQTPENLSKRFGLSIAKIRTILETLQKYNLVEYTNGRWIFHKPAGHLSRDSAMTELNHAHWRQRAILNVQSDDADAVHYTSVLTIKPDDFIRIRDTLIQAISDSRKISDPSPSEEIYCLTLDFFKP